MERPIQITSFLFILILLIELLPSQERWNYSAEEMESTKVNGQEVRSKASEDTLIQPGDRIRVYERRF